MSAAPSLTVLMVEPHADSGEMYAEYFSHHGVAVITVSNATDALAAISSAHVLVTNLRMPGDVDGIGLIGRLRRAEPTKHIPIAVLSSGVLAGDRERANDAGCDVFLTKPCLPDALLREVRRLLLRPKLDSASTTVVQAR